MGDAIPTTAARMPATTHTVSLILARWFLAATAALLTIPFKASAEVRVIEIPISKELRTSENTPTSTRVIQIYGTITPSDVSALERLLPAIPNFGVSLNSNGGDVSSAILMGRALRSANKSAIVGPKEVCVSACVLVLAGATHRAIFGGKVGIHRPYVGQDSAMTPEQQKAQYTSIENAIKQYLVDMNVDPRLYNDMFRISPSNVKYLTSSELRAYGLEGSDPYVEQSYLANRARDLGISTQELLRRQALGEASCRAVRATYGKCYLAIEIGISDKEYARREKVAESICATQPSRAEQVRCSDHIIQVGEK